MCRVYCVSIVALYFAVNVYNGISISDDGVNVLYRQGKREVTLLFAFQSGFFVYLENLQPNTTSHVKCKLM